MSSLLLDRPTSAGRPAAPFAVGHGRISPSVSDRPGTPQARRVSSLRACERPIPESRFAQARLRRCGIFVRRRPDWGCGRLNASMHAPRLVRSPSPLLLFWGIARPEKTRRAVTARRSLRNPVVDAEAADIRDPSGDRPAAASPRPSAQADPDRPEPTTSGCGVSRRTAEQAHSVAPRSGHRPGPSPCRGRRCRECTPASRESQRSASDQIEGQPIRGGEQHHESRHPAESAMGLVTGAPGRSGSPSSPRPEARRSGAGGSQVAVHDRREQRHRHARRRPDRPAPGDRPGEYQRGRPDDRLRQDAVQHTADDHPRPDPRPARAARHDRERDDHGHLRRG